MTTYSKAQAIKLTEDDLKRLGFELAETKHNERHNKWRLKVPYYHFHIQMVLMPYPKTNPNCGVMSLYTPKESLLCVNNDEQATTYFTEIEEFERPIAWYIDNHDRLMKLIVSLTSVNI